MGTCKGKNPADQDVDIPCYGLGLYASVNFTCSQAPPGYCGAFARLVSPWGGAFANFALPGGRAFAIPGAIPEVFTRTRFPIRI